VGTEASDEIVSVSPADPQDEVGRYAVADAAAVDAAVARSRDAFPAWRDAGADARAAILRSFRNQVNANQAELAQLISREMGKALWEARGEAALIGAKVDVTLAEGMRLVAPIAVGPGVHASHHPRGVLAVLGPFNFPAHLPNGHIVPALATGNTVVLKPSEVTPATAEWLAAQWRAAGLPEGVLEVVHGAGEAGRTLATHPDVDAVLFTGSYATGRALREATLDQPGKLLALEMGGNNAVIVLADADLDLAVAETAFSIAATAGQRCTCAGRVFVERALIDRFQEKLVRVLRGLHIGSPFADGVFMGPLASLAAHERLRAARAQLDTAGGERVLRVEPELPAPYAGPGLVRFETTEQAHPAQREEIFGPEAALYPIDDLADGVAAVNNSEYGLAAAVFTRERAHYEACVGRIRCGELNWNKATVGASGKLPFGGGGRSGNDRPAGIASAVYCTFPQAHLESEADFDPESLPPGMPKP
jgi:succinylglutamic semialdehyde dehydrogenase